MRRGCLSLLVEKTEAVVLTTKRKYELPKLNISGAEVDIKNHITYLGVKLHRVLSVRAHVEAVAAKARPLYWRFQG